MTITKPTVLVLGAGASVNYGYPLGWQLRSKILEMVDANFEEIRSLFAKPNLHVTLDVFRSRLEHGGFESIDVYLESNMDQVDIGKFLIAKCLKSCEKMEELFPRNRRAGWYPILVNAMLGNESEGDVRFGENRLTIVSFNYDRSLEAYVYHWLIARRKNPLRDERKTHVADALKCLHDLPLIHVHGNIGNYYLGFEEFTEIPYDPTSSNHLCQQISRQIELMTDQESTSGGFVSEKFQRANEAIKSAERIIFLGFGFHESNLRRLKANFEGCEVFSNRLDLPQKPKEKLLQRLENYGITTKNFKESSEPDCQSVFSELVKLD